MNRLAAAFAFVVFASRAGAATAEAPAPAPAAHRTTALVWTTQRIEERAKLGAERFEAVFPFRNPSAQSVTITAVESSCGCTTARLTKFAYGPGETGEIRAVFEFGDRSGPQQKVLTVHTNDSIVATHLVLRVDIPEAIVLERTVLEWNRAEATTAKTLFARTAGPEVELTKLGFDPAQVEARLTPAPAGGGYLITLRPLSTAAAQRQSVRIDATVAGQPRSLPVYIFVR
jgi:hypothetical protein